MPTLRKIKGKYYGYWYDPERQPKSKSVPMRTSMKSTAEKRMKQYDDLFADGKWDPWTGAAVPKNLTVKEAAAAFLKKKAAQVRPATLKTYASDLRTWQKTLPLGLTLSTLDAKKHVRAFVEDPALKPERRRHFYRHLNPFFQWAVEEGHLQTNPLAGVSKPKQEKRLPEFLTTAQLERVLADIDADIVLKQADNLLQPGEIVWLKDVILLAVGTGMRVGELVSLRWSAVDLDTGFIEVRSDEHHRTKSGDERYIPLVGDARAVIQRLHEERKDESDGPVLRGTNGRRLNPLYVSKRFKYYVRLARLPERIRFHSLRHTCASWLVQRGVSLPTVQAILGHQHFSTTQRYAHHAPDALAAAMKQAFGHGN